MVIFDKQRCLLTDGEYELSVKEMIQSATKQTNSPKKFTSWADNTNELDKNDIPLLNKGPILKFRLQWTKDASPPIVENPFLNDTKTSNSAASTVPTNNLSSSFKNDREFLSNKENEPSDTYTIPLTTSSINNNIISTINNNNNNTITITKSNPTNNSSFLPINGVIKDIHNGIMHDNNNRIQIIYQFLYSHNSRQQTEPCYTFHCPWCNLNCMVLYSLLKHLKLVHARFNFTYVPMQNSARIDVSINDLYDGSPYELVGLSGYGFSRNGPVRRASVTSIFVCRPNKNKRQHPNLSEFLEIDENDLNGQRPYITGHNRY